jgi:ppGpp synthetase/RelA/SpoT-type nucleotidyltranferase
VQSRAKTVSSLAEKCVRRYAKYPDAVRQLTDLCGARVVVQSQQRVQAVREFIEANFEIDEKEARPSR